MDNLEARSRLTSAIDVCEHEAHALEALNDERLGGVLRAMMLLEVEISATLAALAPDVSNES